jgi:hypothetical protein
MVVCIMRIREAEPNETMSVMQWFKTAFGPSRPCDKPAVWQSIEGPVCEDHAEQMIEATMSDKTAIGMLLRQKGKEPKTREEARQRYLRPLS